MISRRRFLQGTVAGGTVAMGIPVLDAFLNHNGTAWAESNAPLPVRFGTWFWGCGVNPQRWVPKTDGTGFALTEELAPLGPVKDQINVLSGFDCKLDGVPNIPHHTGVVATLTGLASGVDHDYPGQTLDTLIAAKIGNSTPYRSLEVSADGVRAHSYSRFSTSVINQSEVSPLELYKRLFGASFQDPKDGAAEPDPRIQLRQSVLSSVMEDAQRLNQSLGSHDRQRMDQYMTSVRELERRLDLLLDGPAELAACQKPKSPGKDALGADVESATRNHGLMADLLVMALACDQTRVVNVVYSWGLSELRLPGHNATHHDLTHNDVIDPELGYQPAVLPFVMASMEAWSTFVQKLQAVPEGDGTLLDNCLILGHSESSFGQAHDVRGLPIMTAGRAGGKVRTGQHIRGNGDPVTRVGLTIQQLVGEPVSTWGEGALMATAPISELSAGLG